MTLYNTAKAYRDSGLSVIPIATDGSKAAVVKWKPYQNKIADDVDLKHWFKDNQHGIAVVAGRISGNLNLLDFDKPGFYERWAEIVEGQVSDIDWAELPLVKTPSEGCYHLYFRTPTEPDGSTKLAQVIPKSKEESPTAIETRNSGYAIAPGSPLSTHDTGDPYVTVRGDLTRIGIVPDSMAEFFYEVAKSLTEVVKDKVDPVKVSPKGDGTRPGDEYNESGHFREVLKANGWTHVFTSRETEYWRRPGKKIGISATYNYQGNGVFYNFSTNASPFEAECSYTAFAVYTLLEHGGNYKGAAAKLSEEGFGSQERHEFIPPSGDREDEEPTFYSLNMLMDGNFKPTTWVVEKLIPAGCVTVIGGDSGIGKSWINNDLVLCVAAGTPFLGEFAVNRGRALIIDMENGAGTVAERLEMLIDGHTEDGVEIPLDSPYTITFKSVVFSQSTKAAAVELFNDEGFSLIVIDPLIFAYSGKENSNEDMGDFFKVLKEIARKTGAGIVVTHHLRKEAANVSNDAGQMLRGASAMKGAIDNYIYIKRERSEDKEAITRTLLVEHNKCRVGRELADFKILLTIDEDGGVARITSEGNFPRHKTKEEGARTTIETMLMFSDGGLTREELIAQCAEAGVKERTTNRAIGSMKKAGKLETIPHPIEPRKKVYRLVIIDDD